MLLFVHHPAPRSTPTSGTLATIRAPHSPAHLAYHLTPARFTAPRHDTPQHMHMRKLAAATDIQMPHTYVYTYTCTAPQYHCLCDSVVTTDY